jgi:hypothetical protein
MIKKSFISLLALVAAATSTVGVVRAQTDAAPAKSSAAKPALKTKLAPAQSGTSVSVFNERTVGLVTLAVARTGSPSFKTLVRNLGAGQKTLIKLPNPEDCLFDIHVVYTDGALNDLTSVDLCKDGKINLVD